MGPEWQSRGSPSRVPQRPPCLVLGPDGQSLAVATAAASPDSPDEQHSRRLLSPVNQKQSIMYTAYLDADDLAMMDGIESARPLDFVAPVLKRSSTTPSVRVASPNLRRLASNPLSRVSRALELEDTAKTQPSCMRIT